MEEITFITRASAAQKEFFSNYESSKRVTLATFFQVRIIGGLMESENVEMQCEGATSL